MTRGGFEPRTELFKARAELDGGCFDNGTPQVKSLEVFLFSCPQMRGLGNQTVSLYKEKGGRMLNAPHFLALILLAALDLANSLGALCNSTVMWL